MDERIVMPPIKCPSTAKDAEPPRNASPADNSPTGSVKLDAQPDSPSLPTATNAELDRKEEVLWQLKKDGLISFDQYQRQLQDLEAAKLLSINKCPAGLHIPGAVKAEFQEGDRTQAIALLRAYGLEAKLNDSIGLTKITVPAGQEWFWVDILQGSGLFAHVGREDYYCPKSIDTTVTLDSIVHPDVSSAVPRANIPRADDLEDVVALLKAKYPKPTEIRVTDRNQSNCSPPDSGVRLALPRETILTRGAGADSSSG